MIIEKTSETANAIGLERLNRDCMNRPKEKHERTLSSRRDVIGHVNADAQGCWHLPDDVCRAVQGVAGGSGQSGGGLTTEHFLCRPHRAYVYVSVVMFCETKTYSTDLEQLL